MPNNKTSYGREFAPGVRELVVANYAGGCLYPVRLDFIRSAHNLRIIDEQPLHDPAIIEAALHSAEKAGKKVAADIVSERIIVRCRKCPVCVTARMLAYQDACVAHWEKADLTVFSTATFSDRFWKEKWVSRPSEYVEETFDRIDEDYSPLNPEHVAFTEKLLLEQNRSAIKRIRSHLDGVWNNGRIRLRDFFTVMEFGTKKRRQHLHSLFFFYGTTEEDIPKILGMLRSHWKDDEQRIGRCEFSVVKSSGRARYCAKYLGFLDKLDGVTQQVPTAISCSKGFRFKRSEGIEPADRALVRDNYSWTPPAQGEVYYSAHADMAINAWNEAREKELKYKIAEEELEERRRDDAMLGDEPDVYHRPLFVRDFRQAALDVARMREAWTLGFPEPHLSEPGFFFTRLPPDEGWFADFLSDKFGPPIPFFRVVDQDGETDPPALLSPGGAK
jgi:hypothetical protein